MDISISDQVSSQKRTQLKNKKETQQFTLEITSQTFLQVKMEYKVRKESQTLLQKVFNNYERRGLIRSYQLGPMLRALNPELNPTEDELRQRFVELDSDRDGGLDFDSFHELALSYLLQQTRRESDGFAHKHLIRLNDFQ